MSNKEDWHQQKEVSSTVMGIKFVLWIYAVLGLKITKGCLYIIVLFYWLLGYKQRKFSQQYINQLKEYADQNNLVVPKVSTFRHFLCFSEALLDRLLCWNGQISLSDLDIKHNDLKDDTAQGILIIGSHLGNMEVCRALSELSKKRKVHLLIQMEQTESFNAILQSLNAESQVNLISISEISPQTMIFLKDALDQGDIVTILADRLPSSEYQRNGAGLPHEFLGKETLFPKGPFVLSLLLQVRTFFLVATKNKNKFDFYLHELDLPKADDRKNRQKNIQYLLKQYVAYLETYTIKYPMQWYNFYNFWQPSDQQSKDK